MVQLKPNEEIVPLSRHKKPLVITKRIIDAFEPPHEFKLFTVYGGLGKGKSTYATLAGVETLVNAYNMKESDAWEFIKQFIAFHPEQFFDKLDQIRETGLYRVPTIIWDDAGLWLYALEWNDPFIKSLGKYMNVARSRLGSMVLTTPSPKWIVKKLRSFPDSFNINITKYTAAPRTEWLRQAKAYQQSMLPDTVKYRVYTKWIDKFKCRMPDDFFRWYKPLRDAYEELAFKLIRQSWQESQEKSRVPELEDFPKLKLPELKSITV